MDCPICEYPHTRPRYEMRDRLLGTVTSTFTLHHCVSCGLLFLDENKVVDQLESFYPPGYWWRGDGQSGGLERSYREWVVRRDQLAFVEQMSSIFPGRKLLDIGCASGTFVKLAREAGFQAEGLEMSPEAVEISQEIVPGGVRLGREDDLIESGEKFDVLTLFHTLEHVPQPFRYLKALQNLLVPGGVMIIQVPNVASLQARLLGRYWYGLDCPRHLYNFTTFSLLHLMGRTGYRIRHVRHFSIRDNAPALVSSVVPWMDPIRSRVRRAGKGRPSQGVTSLIRNGVYFNLTLLAQPVAWLESALGRGATVTLCVSLDP